MSVQIEYLIPILLLSIAVSGWMIWNIYKFNKLRRENYHLVTARFPYIALFFCSTQVINVFILPLLRVTWGKEGDVPCRWVVTINQFFVAIGGAAGVARMYLLVYTHRRQKQISAEGVILEDSQSRSITTTDRYSWVVRHQELGRPLFIAMFMAIVFTFIISGSLLESINCLPEKTIVSRVLLITMAIVVGVLFKLMLKTEDGMHIKTELKMMVFLIVFRIIFENIHLALGRAGPFGVYEIIGTVLVLGIFSASMIYPQYLVKKSLAAVSAHEGKDMSSFLNDTKHGFESFKGYLELEFCVENLLFWRDVRRFQKTPSLRKAYLIYKLYIAPYGTLEVNIPWKVKSKVTTIIGERCQKDTHLRKRFGETQERFTRNYTRTLTMQKTDNSRSGKSGSTRTSTTGGTATDCEGSEKERLGQIFDDATKSVEMLLVDGPFLRFLMSPAFDKWKIQESQVEIEVVSVQHV